MRLNIYNLEKLEDLPKRVSYTLHNNTIYYDYDLKHYISNKNKNPYYICKRIFNNYLGKNFNDAYSEVCKKLPYYRRYYFTKSIGTNRYNKYYIDCNNNIQLNKDYYKFNNEDKSVTFVSIDYKEGYYNKVDKIFLTIEEYNNQYWFNYHRNNFIRVIISGYTKEFASKKDPEYIKLMKIKNKQVKYYNKVLKKQKKQKIYSFLTNEEIQKKNQKELDIIKRDSHGFDENSFRYDPYHGGKNKQ